ncbi:hypothetical protein [Halobacteriovorax sp. HLS]|uniref:hypothetical protein n=1 Tax=Halobacteriovorax sp. HLS TaxID=2234000 RepID=UPI000FDADEFC|nr:hypothetical protein [Halobacteriovorax sp. HLS]
MNTSNDFPKDFFVLIEGDEFREGRISVNKLHDQYMAEIDIVQKDTRKIWRHVKSIYSCVTERDALQDASYLLGKYLRGESI